MARLSEEALEKIKQAAEKISYGTITIYLVESMNSVDIEITERTRFEKATPPRPGEIIGRKPLMRTTRNDG